MALIEKLVNTKEEHIGWVYWCVGCDEAHQIDDRWTFNGDVKKPTIGASILVRGVKDAASDPTPTICHSFVTDGKIRYLGDCTHALKGKTVPMEPLPW